MCCQHVTVHTHMEKDDISVKCNISLWLTSWTSDTIGFYFMKQTQYLSGGMQDPFLQQKNYSNARHSLSIHRRTKNILFQIERSLKISKAKIEKYNCQQSNPK